MYERPHGQVGRGYAGVVVACLVVVNLAHVALSPADWTSFTAYAVGAINGFVLGRVWGT